MIKYVFILCICIYLYGYTHVYIYIYANVLPLAFSNASSCFYGLLKVVPMEVNSQGSWVALGLEGWKGRRFWDVMFPRFPKSKNYPLQTKNHIYCSLTVFLELCVEIERVLVFFVAVSKSLKTNTHTHTHVSHPESKLKQCCNVWTRVLATWMRQVGRWGRVSREELFRSPTKRFFAQISKVDESWRIFSCIETYS